MALSDLPAKVQTLIARFGRNVTLYKQDRGDGWDAPTNASPEATVTVKAVVVSDRDTTEFGTLVRRGDVGKYLISPLDTAQDLRRFEKLLDGSDMRQIESVEMVAPGGIEFLWKIGVAK